MNEEFAKDLCNLSCPDNPVISDSKFDNTHHNKRNDHNSRYDHGSHDSHDSLGNSAPDLMGLDVVVLVKRAQAREAEALLALLRRFAPLLSKWQRRLAEQWPHEEEGALHSEVRFAFVMLVIEFQAERGVPFEGYAGRMIARRLADQNRKERRCPTLTFSDVAVILGVETGEVPDWIFAFPVLPVATSPDTTSPVPTLPHANDSLAEECYCRLWWQEAVTQLTPRQLAVMKLILQGQTEREIAAVLGVQQETVHQSKREAQKKLKEFWR